MPRGEALIVRLLRRKISNPYPYEIFYYDHIILDDQNGLSAVLREYLKIRKAKGIESSLIFFDEITSVRNWWKAALDLINRKR